MGKKSLRRSRVFNQSSTKQSKSIDPFRTEAFESALGAYINTIAEQLITFPSSWNESRGQLLIRLTKFWLEDGEKRRGLAWDVASFCWVGARCAQFHTIYRQRIMQKVLDHTNVGEPDFARLWMLTCFVMANYTATKPVRTEAEWLRSRNDMIDDITNYDEELLRKTHKTHLVGREMTPLESVYYYSKSISRMTQWAFLVQSFFGGYHAICYPRVKITIVSLTENGLITELTIWVHSNTMLKTLLWRLQGELKINLENLKITLQDNCGLAKGSLIMQYSGNKTLEHIGFEKDDVLCIVSADATDVEGTARSNPNDAPCYQTESTSKLTNRRAKKKGKKQIVNVAANENISKSLSRSTTKPNSSSKKQGQPTYCSNIDQDRMKHSKLLTLVFEEATELFQTRRQRLNELSLQKSKPKEKSTKAKPKMSESEPVSHWCLTDTGGKAGKTAFPVLVGHEDFLYKSSKHKRHVQNNQYSIDLHGFTKEKAINKLDSSLPSWIDEAMKESPWTVGVNIITGGGNQAVAEAVEHWIREKKNVANRFT